MYRSRHFKIEELVSPQILDILAPECAWRLIPQGIMQDLDSLRDKHGYPITINGAGNTQCGVRAKNCTIGAPNSDHKLVRPFIYAWDLHSPQLKALTQLVIECHSDYGIFRIEDPAKTSGWLHVTMFDGINVPKFEIFNP